MPKKFLFLQGCTSNFFHLLAGELRARGHHTSRINFNMGDRLFGHSHDLTWNYPGTAEDFHAALMDWVQQHGITDMVMLGDTRPMHNTACQVARQLNLTTHIFEEGYLRPYWLTLERGGINGYSPLPKDPDWYRQVAAALPEPEHTPIQANSVPLLAAWELAYHVPNLLNPLFFPGYRTHRPVISGLEFWGWATRFARMPWYRRRDQADISRLLHSGQPFYLFPLQLDGDSQIVHHTRFASIAGAIDMVLQSFAAHAPADARLVIKNHPLDTGLNRYQRHIRQLARQLNIAQRVLYLESGNLEVLSQQAQGMVTINSTVGLSALACGLPLMALGKAIYDLPGLTWQGDLDTFWQRPTRPDTGLFACFRKVVMHTTQINGGFYSRAGRVLAVRHAAQALEAPHSRLQALLQETADIEQKAPQTPDAKPETPNTCTD